MLKIKTNTPMVDMKGEIVLDADKEKFLLGTLLANTMAGKVDNPSLGWQLGKKFATQEEVELKAEEVVFVKKEIQKVSGANQWMSSLFAGQILEILEGNSNDEGKKKENSSK